MDVQTHAQIIDLLDNVKDMTIATIRPDGFPQATVVAFVHDDLRLYFATWIGAQKARNITGCNKVSATITRPYSAWNEIEGISLGGYAGAVTDPDELRTAKRMLEESFPETASIVSDVGEVAVFRIDPTVLTLLDYSRDFGHAETFELEGLLPA